MEDYKAHLRAAGEKLTIEELIPPRVSAEENSADLLRQAASLAAGSESFFSTNPPTAMRMIAPGKAMIGWRQPDVRSDDGTNTWDEADAVLMERAGELELLRKIIEHPALDFELDYQKGFKLLIPHLAPMKRSAQLLAATAVVNLHRGDTSRATTNVLALLAIARGSQNERLLISQLVRIAIAQIAVTPTWELLQSPDLNDDQLSRMQRGWEALAFIQAAEPALQMERAIAELTITQVRKSQDPLEQFITPSGMRSASSSSSGSGGWFDNVAEFSKSALEGAKRNTAITLWRVSWSYTDELRMLQGEQVLIEAARQVQKEGFFQNALLERDRKLKALGWDAASKLDWLWEKLDDDNLRQLFSQSTSGGIGRALNRIMAVEAAKQMAITAIALKRYDLRHGNHPADLAALVPEFLPAVPRDPVDGKPLRYRRNADGTFLLYSVGEDFTDEGGDPTSAAVSKTFGWQKGRDWVWPQLATTNEIQFYFEDAARRR